MMTRCRGSSDLLVNSKDGGKDGGLSPDGSLFPDPLVNSGMNGGNS